MLHATAHNLFRCWTEPALLVQWFAPRPWTTASAELDLRPGGVSNIVMRSPQGEDMPNPGVYLDIVPDRRLVFTDAFAAGWRPAGQPFMVAEVTFEDLGDGTTRYSARAMHWTAEAKAQHEQMGFHDGWGQCAAQLEDLARTL